MTDTSANSKRIAKNTLMLYFRMLLVMATTLYTSRVVLNSLGIEDYGIYNVIGGMTIMFGFFQSSLSNATQRYLNVALGQKDKIEASHVFSLSQLIYFCFSIVTVIIAELIGLWLIYHKLTIPPDRLCPALWVFHTTIISLFFTINGIVYNSVLIANENMKAYAYLGIIEAVLKLLIALALNMAAIDKLKLYAVLYMLVTISVQAFYAITCLRKYEESHFRYYWDKTTFKEMAGFIGWNGIGTSAWSLNHQGINILYNIFFGPIVNAANGIATQVNGAVTKFSMNFYTAVQPQIVKSYAAGDYQYFRSLIHNSSRYSFYLMLLLSLPIMFRIDYILQLWLGTVPENANSFVIWILIYSLINTLTNPFWMAIQAVGKLKNYIIIGSAVFFLAFPISYICFKFQMPAITALQVLAIIRIIYLFTILQITNSYVKIGISGYITHTLLPIAKVAIASTSIIYFITNFFPQSFIGLLITLLISTIVQAISIYYLGLRKEEKKLISKKLSAVCSIKLFQK